MIRELIKRAVPSGEVTSTQLRTDGDLWDKIKDKVRYSEHSYGEFRRLLESILPKLRLNSNELLIEIERNAVRIKRR